MSTDASDSGTIRIAGRKIPRMGFGAMQLRDTSDAAAAAVLSRSIELGVRLIDTAWYYGKNVVDRHIAASLQPYPPDLVLATKAGASTSYDGFPPKPDYRGEQLRAGNERDRAVLGLDAIPLTHLRWMGTENTYDGVTFDNAVDTMWAMQSKGLIQHVGLSNVTLDQLRRAYARGPIASVSNLFSYGNQTDSPTLDFCTANGIPYLAWGPLGYGATDTPPVKPEQTAQQARIAWLLARSPVTVVIAGTSSVKHLEENIAAGTER